ncbi:hypothetical protein [Alteriqipengyuania sp.]|uniref:hypothetical protein n=1 Tax=Alteriqipengyuania sp. TaxID=2800692 RepID=UPI00351454F1
MNSKLWGIVIVILSAVILLDVFDVIAIDSVLEIVLVAGLVAMLFAYVRARGKKTDG